MCTYRVPYPPVSGERLRTFQIISLLLAAGHEVFLVTFVSCRSEMASVCTLRNLGVRVTCVPFSPLLARLRAGFRALFNLRIPLQVLVYESDRMRSMIAEIISNNRIDVFYVFLARMGQYYSDSLKCLQILDFMDAFSMYYSTRASMSGRDLVSRFFDRYESRNLRKWESILVDRFPLTTAITSRDGFYLARTRIPLVVSTHVDEFLSYSSNSCPISASQSIVFFGEMSTLYSESAVSFAVEEVMPLVWRRFPEATLFVVGSKPTQKISSFANIRVVVTGFVDDIRPYVFNSDVAIVPLFMGSGLKNKIIQSMALRVPVVSTTIGNLGIDARHEEHLLIADNPQDFAYSIVRLLEDSSLCSDIANRAYKYVSNRYSSSVVSKQLDKLISSALP